MILTTKFMKDVALMNRDKELIKNTIILSIGQLIPKILAIVTLPILTSQFTTSEYGEYDLALALSSFLIPIITMQIHQSVFRDLLTYKDFKKRKNIEFTATVFLVISAAFVLIIVVLCLYMSNIALYTALVIALFVFVEAMYILAGQVTRGNGKNMVYSKGAIIYSLSNTVCLVFFMLIRRVSVISAISCVVIGYTIAAAYLKINSLEKTKGGIKGTFDFSELKRMLSFSVPIIPSALSLWIVNLSDRLIVTAFLGSSMNGIYSVANKIPNIYNSTYSIFNMAWIETASKVADEGNPDSYYSSLFEKLFDFLTGVMLFLVAALPLIFPILIDNKYDASYYQTIILFWGAYFNSYVSFYGGMFIAIRKTKSAAISSFLGAVLNVIINIIFINKIGLFAASISTVVSFSIIVLYRAMDINRFIHIKYNWRKIIKGVLFFGVASFLAYKRNPVAIIIIWVLALVYNYTNLYLYKSFITGIISKLKRK